MRVKNILAIAAALSSAALLLRAQDRSGPIGAPSAAANSDPAPSFYRDVLPILQQRCQGCHRPGEIGPFPFETFEDTRRHADAIAAAVEARTMPPWFADPRFGHFSNDPSLTPGQIATVSAWVMSGMPAGNPEDAPPPPRWVDGWNIPEPDAVFEMPQPVGLPAHGQVEYTYEIVPTHFAEGKWVQMSEIRPSSRANVHHAVVYVRPPDSKWLRHAPVGVPFTADDMTDEQDRRDTHVTKADILLVYAPGSLPDRWPDGMAKFIPAGSDLVFQMHYITNGHAVSDRAKIGLVFAAHPPAQRVLTLQLTNSSFVIPPGVDDFRVEVHGTLPNDATLLSFFPHMHLRGKRFEYNIVHSDGTVETLLCVNWNFFWQLSYRLAQPLPLKAGTELQAVAWFDNSRNNPHNPDPGASVRWGDQTTDEMMVGFFDVAVPAAMNKFQYFQRARKPR